MKSADPKFHENLVVASRVESDGEISALFRVEEEDASQQDPGGIQGRTDGLFDDVRVGRLGSMIPPPTE